MTARRHGSIFLTIALLAAGAAAEEPLHVRIDALIDAASVGPVAAPASDADFLRRVYLDLAGMIPSAAETRAFLADASLDKRARLIDRLLDSPQFARHMSLVFDVLLMERRNDQDVKSPEWQEFLRKSLAENKPLDQLFRELVSTDGSDPNLRPAAKFFLDRNCEPNTMTRDLGRIAFGMDLQCAQCHDHPIVGDYLQADYYGLFSFAMRSSEFNDAKAKLKLIAEKGDGDASFKSVFTNIAVDKLPPRLPKGAVAFEPVFAKGEEYTVAPAKDVRPIPKYSRRGQLAAMLADSDAFRRNVANRLWAHMFGRGLVHPADFHHVDNPPSHPELLTLLADELERSGFQTRPMLRELALTRAYQRSCELPSPEIVTLLPMSERLSELQSQKNAIAERVERQKALMAQATDKLAATRDQFAKHQADLGNLQTALAAAKQAAVKAQADRAQAETLLTTKRDQAKAVATAVEAAQGAAAKLPDDKVLAEAAAQIVGRRAVIDAEVENAAKVMATAVAAADQTAQQAKTSEETLAKATTESLKVEQVQQIEADQLFSRGTWLDAHFTLKRIEAQTVLARDIVRYQELAETDPSAAAALWPSLVERWEESCQVSRIRSLSAEQFAFSLMQATGVYEQQLAAARSGAEKQPPDVLKNAAEGDRPRVLEQVVEQTAFGQLRGSLPAFVNLYGTLPGQEAQASVNQALYFGNSGVVEGWLAPAAGRLTERIAKLTDPAALTEELYLSVFTRLPLDDEKASVAAYLQGREADRDVAIREMVWGLLSSNEFRFNH